MFNLVDEHLERLAVNRLDHFGLGLVLLQHPLEDLLLVHQIPGVDGTELVTVEHQRRQVLQIVLVLNVVVRSLDEINVLLFALVIDVLQLSDDLERLLVLIVIFG